jgi:hypothetical protein
MYSFGEKVIIEQDEINEHQKINKQAGGSKSEQRWQNVEN